MSVFELIQVGGFLVVIVGIYWKTKMEIQEKHSKAIMEIQSLKDKSASRDSIDGMREEISQIRSDVYTRGQSDVWRSQHVQESAEITREILSKLSEVDHKLVLIMVTMKIKDEN